MKKVFVVIVENKPMVFGSLVALKRYMEENKMPFVPDVHECAVQKREYKRKGV